MPQEEHLRTDAERAENRRRALEYLAALGIDPPLDEHPAVYTIDEMSRYPMFATGLVCKNLFLRDAKGRRHLLVSAHHETAIDLAALGDRLGYHHLSFASPERLMRYLGLVKGEVTPLGIVNDVEHVVDLVIDKRLVGEKRLGFHPCDNTATVWLSYDELLRAAKGLGNNVTVAAL